MIISYIVFGIVDNAIMYTTGKRIEDKIEAYVLSVTRGKYRLRKDTKGNKVDVSFLCAAIGNAISDFVGGAAGMNVYLAVCSFIGCMLVAVWIACKSFERI